MAVTLAKPRKKSTAALTPAKRDLLEQVVAGGSPLKIDRDKGIIFGVKVLGRYSRNVYEPGSAGTEYSPACMDDAVRRKLYEGQKVKTNHPPDRKQPATERDIHDSLGVLRNVRRDSGADGEPGLYADLHYLKSHSLAESVCEDVERGLGVYGLSHNAAAANERFDSATKRVVIESLAGVRSVDLVDKPATNRNLWESEIEPVSTPKKITIRSLLESQKKRFTPARWSWADSLLEDAPMGGEMDEPPTTASDPDEAMWSGFAAAIGAILEKYKGGELDDRAAAKEVAKYLKAHAKLAGDDEPEPVEESEEDEADPEKKKNVEESGSDEIRGKNKKGQIRAMWHKDPDNPYSESFKGDELAVLREEKAVRNLCESLGFAPSGVQTAALVSLKPSARKSLIESLKAGGNDKSRPKSGFAPKQPAKRDLTESEPTAAESLNMLRG